MKNNLKVLHSGKINLQEFGDSPDGYLFIGTVSKEIPFPIKRFYYINNLGSKSAIRGNHAHKTLTQVIFCVNGSFTLLLNDGKTKQNLLMNDPSQGIILGPMLWHQMSKFSSDCVILVLADNVYSSDDYIRDYHEFINLLSVWK